MPYMHDEIELLAFDVVALDKNIAARTAAFVVVGKVAVVVGHKCCDAVKRGSVVIIVEEPRRGGMIHDPWPDGVVEETRGGITVVIVHAGGIWVGTRVPQSSAVVDRTVLARTRAAVPAIIPCQQSTNRSWGPRVIRDLINVGHKISILLGTWKGCIP